VAIKAEHDRGQNEVAKQNNTKNLCVDKAEAFDFLG